MVLRPAEHSRAVFNWTWEGPPVNCLMLPHGVNQLKHYLAVRTGVLLFTELEDSGPSGAGPGPVWCDTLYHMPGNCAGSPYCHRRLHACPSCDCLPDVSCISDICS